MTTLLIATRNAHKVQEIRQILSDRFHYADLDDCPGAPAVVEDAGTFEGNAQKKAVELAQWLCQNPQRLSSLTGTGGSLCVLADDSGLEVDALGGAPGVHSARFANLDTGSEGNSSDQANNAKLLRLLETLPLEKRSARFRCVLALVRIQVAAPGQGAMQAPVVVSGACEGRIAFAASGGGGFGYDPLFIPTGYEQSFAQLGESVKNTLSHRAQALEKLKEKLKTES